MILIPTDEKYIIKTIRKLENKKADGIVKMQAKILKCFAVDIASPLTYIINVSFKKSMFLRAEKAILHLYIKIVTRLLLVIINLYR